MCKNKDKFLRARTRRNPSKISLFQRMTPAQSRQARAIAYKAALAVIG